MFDFKTINFMNGVDEKTLESVIKNNYKTSIKMQKEIDGKITKPINVPMEKPINTPRKKKKVIKDEDDKFSENIKYYLSLLNGIENINNLEEEINKILPSKNESNYHMIVLRLKAELLKNIKEIYDLIKDEDISLEELKLFREEINLEKEKINTLAIIEEKEIASTNTKQENILIFAKTAGGNIRVLEEISSKAIDPAYYDDFKVLFNSVKNGTFNGFKKFHTSGNQHIRGYQLRKNATRLVFDRVGPNAYAIITAFVKKCTNDNGYRETLQKKISEYSNQRDLLIAKLNQKDFIRENQEYEQILFKKLDNIVTEKTYRKGGK